MPDRRDILALPGLVARATRLVWRAAPGAFATTIGLQAAGSLALAGQLVVGRHLLTQLLAARSAAAFGRTTWTVALLTALVAVAAAGAVVRTELSRLLGELVSRAALTDVARAASEAELVAFEDPDYHDRLQRALVNASVRPLQMTTGVLATGTAMLGAAAVAAVLLTLDPLFVALGAVAAVPLTAAALLAGRSLYRFAVEQTPTDRERNYIQALLVEKDPAKELRAYGLALPLRRRFDELYDRRIRALRRLVRRRAEQGLAGGALTAVVSGGTLTLLIVLVAHHRLSLAGAGTAAASLLLLGGQMQGVAAGLGQLYESALFVRDFADFVAGQSPAEPAPAPAPEVTPIAVRGLTFRYPSRSTASIDGVDLDIGAGEVVALVGENGSGKTTLAKLLAGLYRPAAGHITWAGVDLSQLATAAVQDRVAVLFQDFVHYALAARDNISMGRWERADDIAGVRAAAVRAGADGFLAALPQGYETYLGPQFYGGSDLSGGQWQRVALARAIFRDAALVILDEPTAALDPRAEAALFDTVREVLAGRSVVVISHRFASVRHADRIYVLDAGRVVEHGDHPTLMAKGGRYAEMFTLQAGALGLAPT